VQGASPLTRTAVAATLCVATALVAGCSGGAAKVAAPAPASAPAQPPTAPPTSVPPPVVTIPAPPSESQPAAPTSTVQAAVTVPPLSPVMLRSAPVRVRIPAIGVDSTLMSLGLKSDGSLQVPPSGFPAGWYTGGPTPGERGPAVIVGHVDWGGSAGVFYRLHSLRPADTITVVRQDGSTAVFRVTKVQRFAKDAFPTRLVYGNIGYAGLRVITCGGSFDTSAHSYVDDVVVFATLET
jgi:Sortase domain